VLPAVAEAYVSPRPPPPATGHAGHVRDEAPASPRLSVGPVLTVPSPSGSGRAWPVLPRGPMIFSLQLPRAYLVHRATPP